MRLTPFEDNPTANLGQGGERIRVNWREPMADYAIGQVMNALGPLTKAEIEFAERLYPGFQRNLQRAIGMTDAARSSAPIDVFSRDAQERATRTGMNQASVLRSQGAGSGVQQGAMLNAMNQANRATNQFSSQMFDPMRQAQISMSAAQMGDPNNRMGIPNMQAGLGLSALSNLRTKQSKPTFGEQVLGIGASVIPKIGGLFK